MPPKRVRRTIKKGRPASGSYARMDAFMRGAVWGMWKAGVKREDMLQHVTKKD
jgi:hypothetical protein